MPLNPFTFVAALLLLTPALPALAQKVAKPEPCISIVSHTTPTARTSTYTNKCATACFEFTTTADPEVVPRGDRGLPPMLSRTSPVVVRVEPGQTQTSSWQWRSPDHPPLTTLARNCPSS
jgi:hypothetical protein